MKKILLLVSTIILSALLSGCSIVDEYLENQIKEESGINENADYQQYQAYSEQGKLDKDGYYSENKISAVNNTPISFAAITFAENAYLTVNYYKDSALSIPLNTSDAVFEKGDSIYATVSVNKTVSSSAYDFMGFRLVENAEDGERNELETIVPNEDGLILQLTESYAGKDLSLIPLGKYQSREISLKDTFLDNDEKEHNLSGTWSVNGKPVSGNIAEISPISSYIISYEFDGNEYFYVSSEPECYYSNNEDGVVIFNRRESTDETINYAVQLHQFVSVSLPSKQSRIVSVNNGFDQEISSGNSLEINRLKYGDKVTIITDTEWPELDSGRELISLSSETLTKNGQQYYKYTLVVPQKGGEFEFNPEDYTYAHGTLTFRCFGEEVTSVQYLAEGSKIVYEQCTADDGYWLPDGEHIITVSSPKETRKAIENISFAEKVRVSVELKQPEYGGSIEYYADGSRIDTNVYEGYSGAEITMKFFPWEGWISNYNNGAKYIITQSLTQTVQIEHKDVSTSAFLESQDHKPLLTVTLDKTVGTDMEFGFEASGLALDTYHYSNKWYKGECTIIDNQRIGTEKGISITMSNRAVQKGTAIKILIEMEGEDKSKNKTEKVKDSHYRLVDSLTELQAPIDIYDPAENGTSYIWYDSVKITVSVVDVIKFVQPANPKNGTVTVRNYDNAEILSSGDILEGSEKVTITVSADDGYYVDGKHVKEGIYQTTVKFDECISDISSIIDEHPIVKYCSLTLDTNDAYGSCIYKYGRKTISDSCTVNVKPGDEITMEYTLTNHDYVIDGADGILWTDIGKDRKSVTKTVDAADDGKILTREFFGIEVRKEA